MPLNIRSKDYNALITAGGRSVQIFHKTYFTGSCTAIVTGSGGSVPNATYYYRVNPVSGSLELLTPSQSAAIVVSSSGSRVYLSWEAVTGSSTYKIYRSTSVDFDSPSYLGTTGSNNFYDNSGSAFAGAPTGSIAGGGSWGDGVLNMSSVTEVWPIFFRKPKDVVLDEGFKYEDYRYAYAPSTSKVKYQDEAYFDSLYWLVWGVTSIVVGDQRVALEIQLRRYIGQPMAAQS